MKRLWTIIVGLLVIHFLVAAGGVGWLYASGRLDQQRYERVIDQFKLTIEQEQTQIAKAQRLAEQEAARQEQARRLEAAKAGPITLNDRLTARRQADERGELRLDRLERARTDIQGQIERVGRSLAVEQDKLTAEQLAFDEFVKERTEQWQDEDFQQAVTLLEQQKSKQTKAMLQTLLLQGEHEQVVDYLTAMQVRKAAKVIAEFKSEAEVVQATQLIASLRQRGVYTSPEAQADSTSGDRDS